MDKLVAKEIFEICKIAYKQGWKDSIENMNYGSELFDEIDVEIINDIIDEAHKKVIKKYNKLIK